jgi:hypothetical protein
MFSLLCHLFRAEPATLRHLPARAAAARDNDDDGPRGCGWFDSSHELLSGVTVWEGIIVVDNTVATPS